MPRKTINVLTDDYDGKELPEGTAPIRLSLGRTMYALYLSEDNHGKLLEALEPFITDAEKVHAGSVTASPGTSAAEKERNAKVRHWAIDTKFKYTNAKGEQTTLGDRGRIPEVVVKAWEEAGSPDIS